MSLSQPRIITKRHPLSNLRNVYQVYSTENFYIWLISNHIITVIIITIMRVIMRAINVATLVWEVEDTIIDIKVFQ